MDAHLDTFSTKLYRVNIRVSCIARRQSVMDGFIPETSPPPTLEAFETKDKDDDDDDAIASEDDDDAIASEDDDDGDASSFGIDEMST